VIYLITVETNSLKWLLTLAQRKQTIDGKSIPQVYSVILKASNGRLSLLSLVKDGQTSIMRLSIPCTGEGEVVITDIETTLGVLKYHGGVLNIEPKNDKVTFKSTNKQTTLSASKEAKAFPHNPSSIAQWEEKSSVLAKKINVDDLSYTANDGTLLECDWVFADLDTTTLYEAFRCDSMNGQKFNKYEVLFDSPSDLEIRVGGELKGKTHTMIKGVHCNTDYGFCATYNGGLEHIFANLSHDATIGVWDFTHADMGYPMIISLGDGDYIFQASNL
tara:strand:- start:11798 stop:12622 length:825 start_codon:yes stop_codon:yes gene_type:complete